MTSELITSNDVIHRCFTVLCLIFVWYLFMEFAWVFVTQFFFPETPKLYPKATFLSLFFNCWIGSKRIKTKPFASRSKVHSYVTNQIMHFIIPQYMSQWYPGDDMIIAELSFHWDYFSWAAQFYFELVSEYVVE